MSTTFAKKTSTETAASNADLLAMLALLSNPEKFQTQMAFLEEKERICNEKIALAGTADEIVMLREQTKIFHEEARCILDKSKAEADALLKQANETAVTVVENAKQQSQTLLNEAQVQADNLRTDLAKQRIEHLAQVASDESRINTANKEMTEREKELLDLQISRQEYILAKQTYLSALETIRTKVQNFNSELATL